MYSYRGLEEGPLNAEHLHPDLHPRHICSSRTTIADLQTSQRRGLQRDSWCNESRETEAHLINGMADHVHVLVGLRPDSALSDLVKEIKVASTNLINDKGWVRGRFSWQRGFGAFSYSRSQIRAVAAYIENQERHHSKRSFRAEYIDLLEKFEVEYDQKYLFKFIDDLSSRRG